MTLILKLIKMPRLQFIFLFFQAYKWYELGHKRGHFASVWQRSLYNVNGLKAQPWWTPKETGYTELVRVSVNSDCLLLTLRMLPWKRKSGQRESLYPVTLAKSSVEMVKKEIFLKERFSHTLASVLPHTRKND